MLSLRTIGLTLSNLPAQWLFYLRRQLRLQPWPTAALLLALVSLGAAAAFYARSSHMLDKSEQAHRALSTATKAAPVVALPGRSVPVFPVFNSAQLMGDLQQAADVAKLPLDEVTFTLDDKGKLPYLRYRASLSVSADYPAIRRFVEGLRIGMANVTLDGIHCNREDIGVAELSCDVSLSAFYRQVHRDQG